MPNTSNSLQEKAPAPAIRAYLGGSFDPVHNGHLEVAMSVYQHLLPIATQLQCTLHVSLLPNARSPFKTQSTDPSHRLAMLKLATQETPIHISELELWQAPPVYTIDSVRTLRQRHPNDRLIFIMGMDGAHSLDKWKDGLRLTDYVNLWVFNRQSGPNMSDGISEKFSDSTISSEKNITIAPDIATLQSQLPLPLQPYITDSPIDLLTPSNQHLANSADLKSINQGRIYIDTRPITAVSSTQIREQLQQLANQSNKMPVAQRQIASIAPINDIISNTESNPLAKWLNPAVYQYIIAHQLYSAAQFR
ncbi:MULTISPECIES: nicotinate-nicotinamide nucleotide adenylyltransferase [unclassified Psychrobacter]|uniref:nicotinate-nicotinamide nucleotide adenylyltransferase n=1 Tax=unclassified Psychrobacter TaxID=196806 RepID=UPI0025B459D5|nr:MULTISPECIES: nicotinate-nicotinamide nucleotide adenylyltransferase [unclassified Psychrobacter]MDN3453046.1 nicotinate-nicotinamide nucleotide adenylyltransferase [Psychrobacter sp. APC 3350]MDN3501444.1 nicotinate-nicotinamide nucleotide adenylyltransferase [Psychrobacter sp. 5A.1]